MSPSNSSICRNSIYVNNAQIIYVITPRTPIETRSRDLNQQSALVSIPRCIPGQSQGELSHELTEGVGPRALRHLLARRVAPLADKEEALQEEDRLVPAAGLKQGSQAQTLPGERAKSLYKSGVTDPS